MARLIVGCDVGGTFTDVVGIDLDSMDLRSVKVLNHASDPSASLLTGLQEICERFSRLVGDVDLVVHATTMVSNLVLERQGSRAAFLTTRGFRDLLRIGRGSRPLPYRFDVGRQAPLVLPELSFEVSQRTGAEGEVVAPLDVEELRGVIEALRSSDVESVAVVFLHSYLDPADEAAVSALLTEELPGLYVAASHRVVPEFREYERATTTTLAAYAGPKVRDYLRALEAGLKDIGYQRPLLLMQSSGGTISPAQAVENPAYLLESGPAAGVLGASRLARAAGFADVVTFDMGGTTAKAGLIRNGEPARVATISLGSAAISAERAGGYPVKVSCIELSEVGSGGGSIAWVEPGGVLRVGPVSAGASPGPACYGRGGRRPTITDADLLLGWLSPDEFAGGRVRLDIGAARAALAGEVCEPLGLSELVAAWGIIDIAVENMANAVRIVTVQRGIDPRGLALVAFGGAGPVHAAFIAERLRMKTVVVPPSSGVAASVGLLLTVPRIDRSATRKLPLDADGWKQALAIGKDLADEAVQAMHEGGLASPESALEVNLAVDVRYVGQSHELTVNVDAGLSWPAVRHRFEALHVEQFGHASGDPTEVMAVRVAVGVADTVLDPRGIDFRSETAVKDQSPRTAGVKIGGSLQPVPVHLRGALSPGAIFDGPCLIEEDGTTTVVPGDWYAVIDDFGNLVLKMDE